MYDLSGMGTWVNKISLRRTHEPLEEQRIYEISINQDQSDEILMHFWYDAQVDEEDVASLNMPHPEHTQKIESNFS